MAAVGALAVIAGCAEKQSAVWTPAPIVQWEDLSLAPVDPVSGGYRLHLPQPTRGLFPTSIGITRVAIGSEDPVGGAAEPCLLADPRNEFLQWNSALDDQMAVSEVFPIVARDLGGHVASPEQILAACRGLKAGIGLIYAVNEKSPAQTEMFGILYDTRTTQKLASLHVEAASVPCPGDAKDQKQVDLWDTDSHALVRQRFEKTLRVCVLDLIQQDTPAAVEPPTGWTPAGPILPVEWPPRQLRTGR